MVREEFVGFSFNGRHSSEFNIVRTSDGNRFKYNLLPNMQDKTVAVPGGDGSYLFGTNYTQRPHNINFAYDNLTEEKLIELRQWLRADQVGELIFDEWPHKAWDVKISAPPTISFIPFNREEVVSAQSISSEMLDSDSQHSSSHSGRIYKGEGTITIMAYQPFAHNPEGKKWLNDYDSELRSFLAISGLVDNSGNTYDQIGIGIQAPYVYNAGDEDIPFSLIFNAAEGNYTIKGDRGQLNFSVPANETSIVRFNGKLHLLEQLDENEKPTGIVFNNWITSGDFFELPLGESQIVYGNLDVTKIDYKYKYL